MADSALPVIEKYDIKKEIGRGSMATVYLVHDAFHGRDVAIKVAHPEMLRDAEGGDAFRRMFFNAGQGRGDGQASEHRVHF